MKRFLLPFATGLALCTGLAHADPSDRGGYNQVSPEDRPYLAAHRGHNNGWSGAGLARHGWNGTPRTGSRTTVLQSGVNNRTTVRQRGDNKTAVVIQRGRDTEVIVNQHGDGPGGAWVVTW